ncbi:hypothetical protein BP00DRAFT_442879 [Aspergillus indologenus CBS 114.80]|uniref:ABC-2 type transporter domain-containing protein n=1 Tax=Aspergillus indologenus CBS 114.80 TaxID=1450541 RepID=A0A2V5JG98_9EURO|nr:hypothetical protein BP00DRAFT_442879 [Aspergillus indologenus CBS 114.80]
MNDIRFYFGITRDRSAVEWPSLKTPLPPALDEELRQLALDTKGSTEKESLARLKIDPILSAVLRQHRVTDNPKAHRMKLGVETPIEWMPDNTGVKITGSSDYTIWYDEQTDQTSQLVLVEAKKELMVSSGLPQLLGYVEYLGRYGATIDSQTNPAEFILSTVTSKGEGSKDWPAIWRESPERNALDATLGRLNATPTTIIIPPHLPIHSSTSTSSQAAYALSLWSQTVSVTQRHWLSVWRDGMYLFSKTAKSLFVSLFIAFSFFHACSSLADLQDMWFRKWAIFTAREQNGIYDWRALVTALVAVEIPWQLGIYTVVFLATYWTVGIGYSQLLAACFPDPTLAGYANSLIWVILMVCSGVLTPHAYMNDFYRPWLFWVDPMRYFFGATVGVVLHDVPVHCGSADLVRFEPPPGLTCGQYVGPSGSGGGQLYLDQNPGYLVNPNATAACEYCPYIVGDDYLSTLEYGYGQRWWNWAAFLGFCCSNFVLLYGVVWLTKGREQRRTTK